MAPVVRRRKAPESDVRRPMESAEAMARPLPSVLAYQETRRYTSCAAGSSLRARAVSSYQDPPITETVWYIHLVDWVSLLKAAA